MGNGEAQRVVLLRENATEGCGDGPGTCVDECHKSCVFEVNRQVCRVKANRSLHLRDIFTCPSFLFSCIHTLMTLLMWVTMKIMVFGILKLYLDEAKSHDP